MAEAAEQLPDPDGQNTVGNTGQQAGLRAPWQKGQSGNPGGRPKGLARLIREQPGLDGGATLVSFWSAVMAGSLPDGRKVDVKDSLLASRLLAERGWGKPPEFAPIEDDDPLGLSDRQVSELAAEMDAALDELAAKRRKREKKAGQ